MLTREKQYTADDLWELSHKPEYAEKRLELSEGMLIEMSPTGGKHGVIALKLGRLVGNFVEAYALGIVTAAETGYILDATISSERKKRTVRAPDVGFLSNERISVGGLPDEYIPVAPDLAVEVVSPSDKAPDLHTNIAEYLRCGTRLVWVVYPDSHSVEVHTTEGAKTLYENDTLDGGDVLPGFSLPVRDIFPAS